jgi:hypothetical protein
MAGGALFVRLLAAAALHKLRRDGMRPAGECGGSASNFIGDADGERRPGCRRRAIVELQLDAVVLVVVLLASLREARNGDGDAERMPLGSTDACSGERCSLAYWSSGRRRPDPAILLGEVMAGKVPASDDEELQWPCKAVVLCRRGNRRRAAVRAAGHAEDSILRFIGARVEGAAGTTAKPWNGNGKSH